MMIIVAAVALNDLTLFHLFQHKLLSSVTLLTGGSLAFVGINVYNGNPSFYRDLLMPAVHRLVDPEMAHIMAVKLAKYQVVPKVRDLTTTPEQAKLLVSVNWTHNIQSSASTRTYIDQIANCKLKFASTF